MSQQLLARYNAADHAAWRKQFDAGAESHGSAGLSVLQIWWENEAGSAWVLYRVNDRAKAETYLAGTARAHAATTPVTHHFLDTV